MKLASFPNPLLRGWRFTEDIPAASLLYRAWRRMFQVTITALCRVRVFNRHYEPQSGSAAYICNHQSFLDPMLMSYALRRPMNFMARDSLFRLPLFGQMIGALNAFPVKRNTADTGAIKEAMRRLKAGGQVAVFAEGTRTLTGHIGPFLPGAAMLAQRAADWTVPVVIDGAFEAWPRHQLLPHAGSIVVQYAPPIPQDEARKMGPKEFLAAMRSTIIEMQAEVRRRLGRPPLTYN